MSPFRRDIPDLTTLLAERRRSNPPASPPCAPETGGPSSIVHSPHEIRAQVVADPEPEWARERRLDMRHDFDRGDLDL